MKAMTFEAGRSLDPARGQERSLPQALRRMGAAIVAAIVSGSRSLTARHGRLLLAVAGVLAVAAAEMAIVTGDAALTAALAGAGAVALLPEMVNMSNNEEEGKR